MNNLSLFPAGYEGQFETKKKQMNIEQEKKKNKMKNIKKYINTIKHSHK